MFQSILVSGVPATGKSTFGRWLAENRGFVHIDVENGGFDRYRLAQAWAQAVGLAPEPLVDGLRSIGQPAVVDWGYPPSCLPIVRALHAAGLKAWWFDGAPAAARHHFIQRGNVSVQDLDAQIAAIQSSWNLLQAFYGERVVETVRVDGTFRPWDEVSEILGL